MKKLACSFLFCCIVTGFAVAKPAREQPNPPAKVLGACEYNVQDGKRFALFAKQDQLEERGVDYGHFTVLIDEARASIVEDSRISIDMRPCWDPLLEQMGIACNMSNTNRPEGEKVYEVGQDAIIGYNGKFRTTNNEWRTDLDPLMTTNPPMAYGTRLGEVMFRADAWLKGQLFEVLLYMYEDTNYPRPERSSHMNFVPDIDFSYSSELARVYITVDGMDVAIERSDSDPVVRQYAKDFAEGKVGYHPHIDDLVVSFYAAFWGFQAERCKKESVSELEYDEERTPLTYPLRAGEVRRQGEGGLTLRGGVIPSPIDHAAYSEGRR